MDFGLQLATLPARDLLETARNAESWGYAALYVPDHWAYERQGGGGLDESGNAWEATTILGALAVATSKARIGALVLCNLFRHPATTAQAITTLDHVSGGRAILGLGSGWTKAEFDMTGMAFPEVTPRLRMLDEAVRCVKALWTKDRTTFDGEFYHLRDAFLSPRPVQTPHPPVMLGGNGKGILRIAAREADHLNIISDAGRAGTILMSEVAKLTEEAFSEEDRLRPDGGEGRRAEPRRDRLLEHDLHAHHRRHRGAGACLREQHGRHVRAQRRAGDAHAHGAHRYAAQCVAELKRRERTWGTKHYIMSGFGGPAIAERFAREIAAKV
jgi:alkanesulfonate monooxygenase SsuD/methylene tetrahydromethanopterin reductase-like flavin-dependent oxidoreductase (luciferase family)